MTLELLARRTWRDLRATARMYRINFDNLWTREQALAGLRRALLDERHLEKALKCLSAEEREALMALKAHHGAMMRYEFSRAFGKIRPYRPWRDDAPPHPWRRPISIAEKLWYLGMIEVQDHQAILLPDSVATCLPEVPHPQTVMWEGDTPDLDPASVVRDVAALLGALLNMPVRPLHGRWLAPSAIKAINLRLAQPESLSQVRSEFQTERIRFLHYVAQAAGLLSLQQGRRLPSALAWTWLALPYKEAHAQCSGQSARICVHASRCGSASNCLRSVHRCGMPCLA